MVGRWWLPTWEERRPLGRQGRGLASGSASWRAAGENCVRKQTGLDLDGLAVGLVQSEEEFWDLRVYVEKKPPFYIPSPPLSLHGTADSPFDPNPHRPFEGGVSYGWMWEFL